MNLTEIVNRKITEPFTTEEISFVIQEYLSKAKSINVKVDVESTIQNYPPQMHVMLLHKQLPHILNTFDRCRKYLKEHFDN